MRALLSLLPLLISPLLHAQRGDRPGEKQALLPDTVQVPPAPARTPQQELATMTVAAGFELQLFAAEPMIADPVVTTWDAHGRMWVCEFRNYMLDIDATDEQAPTGRIVVLHDDDGDGRADRSTVFADRLILPRAVLPMPGGALVITPPNLVWMPDADGDLVADGPQQKIMGGFEAGTGNPEHSGNGLTWGFDHRIHLSNDKRLLRQTGVGTFAIEPGSGGGQWGLCHDDRGRFYFNYNSDWLRCNLVPSRYAGPAGKVGGLPSLNHRVVQDRSVWPNHVSPGVNRGYQKGLLKDWVLSKHTAVCSPVIYRGSLLPFDGDAFICEPAGNVVRRVVMRDIDGLQQGDNAYQEQKREFLWSTDERFRPVHLSNGPDGALYVVDMYRGVIQHRNYVTSFLRDQVKKRGLEDPVHLGRIWRVVPKDASKPAAMPQLAGASAQQLVDALRHASGTVRDLALRQLVQGNLREAVPALRQLLGSADRANVRIAAMSALAGLGSLGTTELRRCVRDADAGVIAFALQHAGDRLAMGDAHLWAAVDQLDSNSPATVRWHAALAIGDAFASDEPLVRRTEKRAFARLARFVSEAPADSRLRAAVATAAHPNLAIVLSALSTAMPKAGKHERRAIQDLAYRAVRGRDAKAQVALIELAGGVSEAWQREAMLAGAVRALPKGGRRVGWLALGATPAALVAMTQPPHGAKTREHAGALLGAVRVAGTIQPGVVTNLSEAERLRVQQGAVIFRGACAACHQLDGKGQRGLAPPLRDSEWVTGPKDRLMRIALHGVKGPIEVDGSTWDLEMPAQAHMSDAELAKVLSYLRRAFGHQASCIEARELKKMRKLYKRRAAAWTAAELLQTK